VNGTFVSPGVGMTVADMSLRSIATLVYEVSCTPSGRHGRHDYAESTVLDKQNRKASPIGESSTLRRGH